MSFTLGARPLAMDMVLPRDADFVATLTSTTGVWPGDALTLVLLDGTGTQIDSWDADIAGPTASFTVAQATVAAAITAGARTVRAHTVENGVDQLWASGPVSYA